MFAFWALFSVPNEFRCPFAGSKYLKMPKISNFRRSCFWRSPTNFSHISSGRTLKQSNREPVHLTPYLFLADLQRNEWIPMSLWPILISQNVKNHEFFFARFVSPYRPIGSSQYSLHAHVRLVCLRLCASKVLPAWFSAWLTQFLV